MKTMKEEKYITLLTKIISVISNHDHFLSNLSNTIALIKECFGFHWVGFYLVDFHKNQLFLGPFQGPIACTLIKYGQGVCGTAWKKNKPIIVDDVHKFEGHIACSTKTNSEIVIPIKIGDKIIGVLDIDSINYKEFDNTDLKYLSKIINHLSTSHINIKEGISYV